MADHDRHGHDRPGQSGPGRDRAGDRAGNDTKPEVHAQSVATANILTAISELETANTTVDFTDLKRIVLAQGTASANREAGEPGPLTSEVPPGVTPSGTPGDRQRDQRHPGDDRTRRGL